MRILAWIAGSVLTIIAGIYQAELRCWAGFSDCAGIKREVVVSNHCPVPVRLTLCFRDHTATWHEGVWDVGPGAREVSLATGALDHLEVHRGAYDYVFDLLESGPGLARGAQRRVRLEAGCRGRERMKRHRVFSSLWDIWEARTPIIIRCAG